MHNEWMYVGGVRKFLEVSGYAYTGGRYELLAHGIHCALKATDTSLRQGDDNYLGLSPASKFNLCTVIVHTEIRVIMFLPNLKKVNIIYESVTAILPSFFVSLSVFRCFRLSLISFSTFLLLFLFSYFFQSVIFSS